jgi:hypothetical protein
MMKVLEDFVKMIFGLPEERRLTKTEILIPFFGVLFIILMVWLAA